MKRNRLSGFSLMEILIAVIIIGILATIATQSFQAYRDRAHRSVDETNLKMLAQAVKLYAYDNGTLPASLDLLPRSYYTQSLQAITCPSDVGAPPGGPPTGFDAKGFQTGGSSYAINVNAVKDAGSNAVSWLRNSANAGTILLFESDSAVGDPSLSKDQAVRHNNGRWGRIKVNEQILWD